MKTRIAVYDRLENKRTVSTHKSWELAEMAANKLGCGDRFGLKYRPGDKVA